jgi:hypothetical protein
MFLLRFQFAKKCLIFCDELFQTMVTVEVEVAKGRVILARQADVLSSSQLLIAVNFTPIAGERMSLGRLRFRLNIFTHSFD